MAGRRPADSAPADAFSSSPAVKKGLFEPALPTYGDSPSAYGSIADIFDDTTTFVPPERIREWRMQKNDPNWRSKKSSSGEYSWSNEPKSATSNDEPLIYDTTPSQPSELSSSLHYGSRDDHPVSAKTLAALKKKEEEYDDPNMATRGNWWQGSLYY